MFKASWLQQLLIVPLCLIAFAIPWPYMWGSICVLVLCFVWLLQCNPVQTIRRFGSRKLLLPWLVFFLLHVASYFYSHDKSQSLFDIQEKLSFVVFPVVVGAGVQQLSRLWIERIFLSFALGITAVAIFCLAQAGLTYLHTHQTSQFFYHTLVTGLDANAVYQSWYAVFSLSILLLYPWQFFFQRHKVWKMAMVILQIIFLVLLSSRTLIALFLVCLIPIYIARLYKSGGISKARIALIGLCAVLLTVFLFATHNPVRQRYDAVLKDSTNSTAGHFNRLSYNNFTLRIFLWKTGLANIKEHNLWLLGCGNGDVGLLQNRKMTEEGIPNIYSTTDRSPFYNINLHNMYMQSFMMLGVVGLIVFLLIVLGPLVVAGRLPRPYADLFILFHLISAIYMMQEAALQTQAGIIFYSFFTAIFWNLYYSEKDIIKTAN